MVHFDPYDHKIHDDPYPSYRRPRDEVPLHGAEPYGMHVPSRYADISRAARDFRSFSTSRRRA